MKKKYTKPEVYLEEFNLTEHIAACSSGRANQVDANSCGFNMGDGMVIFWTSVDKCTFKVSEGTDPDNFGEYCYNNPSEELKMFGS